MATVQVIATARGHCGKQVREPGDVFPVDAKLLDKRPRFERNDKGEQVQVGFYDPPSWFEEVVEQTTKSTKSVPKSKAKSDGDDLT